VFTFPVPTQAGPPRIGLDLQVRVSASARKRVCVGVLVCAADRD
jgi:hypothetical protein